MGRARFVSLLLCGLLGVLVPGAEVGAAPAAATADSLLATAPPDTIAAGEMNVVALEVESAPEIWRTGVSPTAAVIMTPFFPGWGQLYAENSWRAGLGFGLELYYWTQMLSRDRQARRSRDFARNFEAGSANYNFYNAVAEENWEQMRDFAWWSGGVLLIVALDAYVGAHLFEFDEDPVPVPDRWDEQFGPSAGDTPLVPQPLTLTVFQWRKTF
jgi:hypothetical protein